MFDVKCALCGNNKDTNVFSSATFSGEDISKDIYSARRLPDKIHYQLLKCQKCGLIFSSPILPPAKIAKLYKESAYTYGDQVKYVGETYLSLYKRVKHMLPANPKILDIGCGNGFFLELLKKEGVKNVYGVEPGMEIVQKAPSIIQKNIKVGVFKNGLFTKNSFDLVCCFHTLDHVVDPNKFLKDTKIVTKEGGLVLFVLHDTKGLSVKLFGDKSPIFDIEHVYLFNKKTLRQIFEKNGFEVVKVFNVVNTYPLSYWWRMSGIPRSIKIIGEKLISIFRVGDFSFSLPAGNIGIVAKKT